MAVVWYFTAYQRRETESIKRIDTLIWANGTLALVGWTLGWSGLVFYNFPRVWNLVLILRYKASEGLEPWMFLALMGEKYGSL